MAERDEVVSDEVIARLWPDLETRPAWAMRCSRCGLIYTRKMHHFFDCPERSSRTKLNEAQVMVANYERDAAQRSEDGRTDWDYEQRIKRVEAERDALQQRIDAALALLRDPLLNNKMVEDALTALTAPTESKEPDHE